MIGTVNWNK